MNEKFKVLLPYIGRPYTFLQGGWSSRAVQLELLGRCKIDKHQGE